MGEQPPPDTALPPAAALPAPQPPPEPMHHQEAPLLDFRQCDYTIRSKQILHSVSGSAHAGRLLALIGPSGAGKSVLLRLLCHDLQEGVIGPSTTIRLDQRPLTAATCRR